MSDAKITTATEETSTREDSENVVDDDNTADAEEDTGDDTQQDAAADEPSDDDATSQTGEEVGGGEDGGGDEGGGGEDEGGDGAKPPADTPAADVSDEEEDVIEVQILRRSSTADQIGTKSQCYVSATANLTALRAVLEEDGTMETEDKFWVGGILVGKSGEKHTTLAKAKGKNDYIVIIGNKKPTNAKIPDKVKPREDYEHAHAKDPTLPGGDEDALDESRRLVKGDRDYVFKKPRRLFELTDEEKEVLLFNSGLGKGFNIKDDSGPVRTGYQSVDGVSLTNVIWTDTEKGGEDILISYSARAQSYAKSGWAKAALTVESPFVSASADVSLEFENTGHSATSTINVTGRYCYSKCQVTLQPGCTPTRELKAEVDKALQYLDSDKRKAELEKVWQRFGHVYIASVEMGGMKHTTSTKTTTETENADSLKAEMSLALGKKFGPVDVSGSIGGGYSQENKDKKVNKFEQETFTTVGGITEETDVTRWKASLNSPGNWSVTLVLRVESIIDLFDEATQNKILDVAPQAKLGEKVPLYHLHHFQTLDHIYTIDKHEVAKRVKDGYTELPHIAQVHASLKPKSIPLYRVWHMYQNDHIYTTNSKVKDDLLRNGSEGDIACYVFAKKRSGTVPLHEVVHEEHGHHMYVANSDELDNLTLGYWVDQGVVGWVYAP